MANAMFSRWLQRKVVSVSDIRFLCPVRIGADWLSEVLPKAINSYRRDRSMGLDHERALEHSLGNWQMTVNMRREMAGQPHMTDTDVQALRQGIEQAVLAGGSDLMIAHAMPQMTRVAKDAARDYSCLMVYINDQGFVRDFDKVVQSIAEEDVYDPPDDEKFGREDKPHVTVKYGLHTGDAEDVRGLVENFGPIEAKIKCVSFFRKDGKDYDVLKFDIVSDDLSRLRAAVEKELPATDEHPDYHPHMTIAYLKRGTAEKYVNDLAKNDIHGKTVVFDTVSFSDKDSTKTDITCVKTASSMWMLHLAKSKHSPAYEKETALIRENKKKPQAKAKHGFKPAKWTHPNGHPRCLVCGGEEIIGGVCNKEPSAKDFADFEKELDAEFPGRRERREASLDRYARGEITQADVEADDRAAVVEAMSDKVYHVLLAEFESGNMTQTEMNKRMALARAEVLR